MDKKGKKTSFKNTTLSNRPVVRYRKIEDDNDLTSLNQIAATGTRNGFIRAQKVSKEMVIVQQGKLVRKVGDVVNEVISNLEGRRVKIGEKTTI